MIRLNYCYFCYYIIGFWLWSFGNAFQVSSRLHHGEVVTPKSISRHNKLLCPSQTFLLSSPRKVVNSRSCLLLLFLSPSSSVVLTAEELANNWRQYVPLVVSCGVIIDILLGSPLANAALSVVRPPDENEQQQDGDVQTNTTRSPWDRLTKKKKQNTTTTKDPKERIDTVALARQALDKASATKELRQFLDDSKSDWDKIREIQRKMDQQLAEFDASQKKNDN